MKKMLLLCLVTLLSATSLASNENVLCLGVVETDGKETYFAIEDEPLITYSENTVTIVGPDYTIENLSLDNVVKLYHTESIPTVAGLGNINSLDSTLANFTNGKVLITSLKEGSHVYVYTVDGQKIGSFEASQDGNVCIDLTSLRSGAVYILRTPTISFKIVK